MALVGVIPYIGFRAFPPPFFADPQPGPPPLSLSQKRGIGARLGDPPRHLERWRVVVVVDLPLVGLQLLQPLAGRLSYPLF